MTVIEQGLLITGIGMGLVFVVIIFLWGLMALMMRVTSGKKRKPTEESLPTQTDEPLEPELENAEGQRRAAAAAVAVSLAMAMSGGRKLQSAAQSDQGNLSPWQAVHRARQLEEK
ncbi:OadG family protein [Chloroflexota bacterium]|nr:OadG family protein [Chloroflexota bacterium]